MSQKSWERCVILAHYISPGRGQAITRPQIKYAKKYYQRLCKQLPKLIRCPLVVISVHNSHPHSSNMTALNTNFVAYST